jgi:hypothetical protein
MRQIPAIVIATLALGACAGSGSDPQEGADLGSADLPIGDVDDGTAEGMKADSASAWGSALTCKPIPNLPALPHPEITISLQGQTLHLVDRTVGYDRVFPVGPGKIDTEAGSLTYGESLSYWPVKAYKTGSFTIKPSTSTACKFWWTDPETGAKSPVFAGLPFMSWSGSYAIHGPIDNFTAPNGGNLRRGFVSHGCVRLEAADILEVYARVHGAASVPVHVQREPERLADGTRADVTPRWVGAECASDSDCPYANGFCKHNPYGERGFCSAHCTLYCADKLPTNPPTFCVSDPDAPGQGMCVPKVASQNPDCRTYDHFAPLVSGRNSQPGTTANVCLPGTQGAIGDHCFLDTDCDAGNHCAGAHAGTPGLCTQSCTKYCPDPTGAATTMCVNDAALGGPSCMRTCTPSSNASECPAGTACVLKSRNGDASTSKYVCEPAS